MRLTLDGIIFETQYNGGISRLFATILPLMCELDPSLHITVCLSGRPRHPIPVHPRITTKRILPFDSLLRPRRYWRWAMPTVRGLALMLAIDADTTDVWHSTYFTYPLKRRLPSVVVVYDLIHEKYASLFRSSEVAMLKHSRKRIFAHTDRVICISETTATDVEAVYGVPRDRIEVVHLAPDPHFHSDGAPYSLMNRRPYLLYVGRRMPYKNFDTLLAAFERWDPSDPVDLVVVGPPWSRDETNTISEHKRRERIHLLTGVDDESLAALYRGATAFIYPSLYEGFGIPLLEAIACGCPVVASRIPASQEIAGSYPIYFDATSVDELISALDAVTCSGRSDELQAIGKELLARYSWEKTAASILTQYYVAAGEPPPDDLVQALS